MTEEEVEDLQEQMENDYAIGSLIATALVPNAVDHFLGLHLEDDEDEGRGRRRGRRRGGRIHRR